MRCSRIIIEFWDGNFDKANRTLEFSWHVKIGLGDFEIDKSNVDKSRENRTVDSGQTSNLSPFHTKSDTRKRTSN